MSNPASTPKDKYRTKLPCTQQLQLKVGYQKVKKPFQETLYTQPNSTAAVKHRIPECLSCVLVNYRARGWARDQSVFVAFPQPLHLNSRTKCSRRVRTTTPTDDQATTTTCSRSATPDGGDQRAAQPLEAVNIVCRAWLQNTKQLTVDHMKTMFYGKCDQSLFPACSLAVRIRRGRLPQTLRERAPFLAPRRFSTNPQAQSDILRGPRHTTVSLSYCARGSHGIAGSDNIQDSLLCAYLVSSHLWRLTGIPMALRYFAPVNITAKGGAAGCIDIQALADAFVNTLTYQHSITLDRWYPAARIKLDRPFDALCCVCSTCSFEIDLERELNPRAVDPRQVAYVQRSSPRVPSPKTDGSVPGGGGGQKSKTNGKEKCAKLMVYDTGRVNIAGLRNVLHFEEATRFIFPFICTLQQHFPITEKQRRQRHAKKRQRLDRTTIPVFSGTNK